ncbi:tetratricopeptide repeat protein [Desulfovibrio falkowii]|uniref:tetratricopeptide repeat protein n=1 Tax=Desulfovibrio sp. WGS1351 TaxID=3366814 RepID=UPI00372D59E9
MYISGMRRSKFSGVYSFSTDWTESRRKTHYFVWELPDGAFAVQELNNAFQPLADPERISARSFKKNFKAEPEILAMPVTTPDLTQLESKNAAGNTQQTVTTGQKTKTAQETRQEEQPRSTAQPQAPEQDETQGGPKEQAGPRNRSAGGHEADPAAGRESVPPDSSPVAAPQKFSTASQKSSATSPAASAAQAAATQRSAVSPEAPRPRTAEKQIPLLQKQKSTAFPEAALDALARSEAEKARSRATGSNLSVSEDSSLSPPTLRSAGAATVSRVYDPEAARKAKMTESKLRETFRQALLRLKRPRERQGALKALEQLAETTEDICTAHKHMFRDFGVRLRQSAHPDLALLFSRKVVQLAPDDDHAHFNLARILCMLGQYDDAAAHIRTAMSMNSDKSLYFRMLVYIRKEKLQNRGRSASPGR